MKILLATILTALLAFIAGLFLPWWSIAIVAFLVALLLNQSLGRSFLSGLLGIFILWTVVALWIDIKNESILSQKIAQLFSLGSTYLLVFVSSLIGGIVGGFAAMSGASLHPSKKVRR